MNLTMSFFAFLSTLLRKIFAPHIHWLPYLAKRALTFWTSLLPRRSRDAPKALSAAQRCNDDVLEEIFQLLPRPTLANAARVCHGWLPSARRNLYRTLYFDSESPSAWSLAQALSANVSLRSFIRRPSLRYFEIPGCDLSMFDWLALLPEESLQSITFLAEILYFRDSEDILSLPAIRTTMHITCRSLTIPRIQNALLNMSQLVSLAINVHAHFPPPTSISLPNLKRLSIVTGNYSPTVDIILQGLSKPLTRFDIKTVATLEEEDIMALQASLLSHAPHLEHLSLASEDYFSRRPFVDDYIAAFTSLRTLFCSYPSYTPRIISQLPSTLTSLTIRAPMAESFDDAAFAGALGQHQHRLPALWRIRVVDDSDCRKHCDALGEFCRPRGIDFATMDRDPEYYFFS